MAATNQSPVGTMTNGPKVLLRTLLDQANATQWVEINFPAILVTIQTQDTETSPQMFRPSYGPVLKFIYSENATKFCEISTVDLAVTT